MRIRDKASGWSWCARSLEQLERELETFVERGYRIPEEPGGWWHQYVCPEHHTELRFDPMEPDAHHFHCPHGCVLEGEPYRGGWLVFKHQSLARYALQAAAVYAGTGKAGYAELALGIFGRYAERFPLYPIHPEAQAWMLKGRAFHQALSEAIWATTLIRAYLLLRDEGADFNLVEEAGTAAAAWEMFLSMLEASMTQYRHILIHDRGTPESNYTAWLNAALAAVYAAQGEPGKLLELIEGEGGFAHHLSIGVKPDQFEYEGSTYYHVFVLRAYLITAEMAARFGVDLQAVRGRQGQSLQGMLELLADLAGGRGELPALHDGPYKREPYAREIAEVLELGLVHMQGDDAGRFGALLEETYRQLDPGQGRRSGLEAVVFGTGAWDLPLPASDEDGARSRGQGQGRRSRLLAESGFAVLRHPKSPLSALIDFGPHGGSHGHYDKLHLTIGHRDGAVTPELGMVPYGSQLRKEWYASTASHNTISIGGRSQAAHEGECMAFRETERYVYVWARSERAYEGYRLDRHLLLTSEWLLDWVQVEAVGTADGEASQPMDWWLHHLGVGGAEGTANEDWEPCASQSLGEGDGYAHVQAVSRWLTVGDSYELLLPVDGKQDRGQVRVTGLACGGERCAVYQFTSLGTADDPSRRMGGLVHRQAGQCAMFVHIYADSGALPVRLRRSDSGEVEIEQGSRRFSARMGGAEGLIVTGLE